MLLVEFKEFFSWKPSDMPGISREGIAHYLKINPSIRSVAQKCRPVGEEKAVSIRQEVGKLIDANFVKESKLQTWVANPVLVK